MICVHEELSRGANIGVGDVNRGLTCHDPPVQGFDQGEGMLDLVDRPPVDDDVGVQLVVAGIDHPLPPRALLRKAEYQRRGARGGKSGRRTEVHVPSRNDREIERGEPVSRSKTGRIPPTAHTGIRAVQIARNRRGPVKKGAHGREGKYPVKDNGFDYRIRSISAQVFKERGAQNPVSQVIKLDDQDSPACAEIYLLDAWAGLHGLQGNLHQFGRRLISAGLWNPRLGLLLGPRRSKDRFLDPTLCG